MAHKVVNFVRPELNNKNNPNGIHKFSAQLSSRYGSAQCAAQGQEQIGSSIAKTLSEGQAEQEWHRAPGHSSSSESRFRHQPLATPAVSYGSRPHSGSGNQLSMCTSEPEIWPSGNTEDVETKARKKSGGPGQDAVSGQPRQAFRIPTVHQGSDGLEAAPGPGPGERNCDVADTAAVVEPQKCGDGVGQCESPEGEPEGEHDG
eukprot:gene12783-biopygen5656